MIAVILCGGSGSRLWPLSRKNYPKQFLNLCGENSLLQDTFLRLKDVVNQNDIFIIGNKENYFNIYNQIRDVYPDFDKNKIFIEPVGLNTAPAIAFSIKTLLEKFKINKDELILFLPADHYIEDVSKYKKALNTISNFYSNLIITIGIKPVRPEVAYGYIKKGEKFGEFYKVSEFKEKPDLKTAEEYLKSGEYVWNSGMYVFSANVFIEECRKYCLEIYELMEKTYEDFVINFKNLIAVSIDYAISEKTNRIIVFEGDFGWSDIGSFDRLAELKNIKKSNLLSIDSKNIFSYSTTNKLIVALGVEDLNIIENNDSILIHKKNEGEQIKKVVDYLKNNDFKELEDEFIVYRPWGRYEVLIDTPNYKVKKIIVHPGEKLSLQSHMHRAEHWIVVYGIAKVTNNGKDFFLRKNESTYIEQNAIHRLENPGKINLEVIEVQTGKYLEEDDIERYDNVYNVETK